MNISLWHSCEILQAEQRILQLNRMYLIRSHINQAIVRIREKVAFFQEICNVVVRHGNFKLAWIGMYDEEKVVVTPITFSGEENGYLEKYNLINLNKEGKNGPIAIAIREDQCVICQDIEVDDRVLTWREEALKRGYKSVSTIPLKCNRKIIGVLMVYGAEPNIFGSDYEKLLNEIGEDISFALDFIKREEELKNEMALKKARDEQLRRTQKMEALGQLSGGIAHDFNNILGIIVGSLELTEMHVQERKFELALDRIQKTIRTALRGSKITQKLLSFSRKTNDESEIFNPNTILENLNEILKRLFLDQELTLETVNTPILIQCNSTDFENAILNLCINARDATGANGKIQINVSTEHILEQDTFKYNLPIKAGEYVKISIIDNGIGISEEHLQKLFIPFFTTKPDGKGTGLGLANVYSFIELSKGGIKFDSEIGKGTRVTLVFPLIENSEQRPAEESIVQTFTTQGSKKILIVDDEESLLDLLEAIFQFSGYTVLRASNSNHAYDLLLKEKDIDLLFTDILLTGSMDGYKLAENATREFPDLKVLLTSGLAKDLQKGHSKNFPIIPKPYRTDELIKQVKGLLER